MKDRSPARSRDDPVLVALGVTVLLGHGGGEFMRSVASDTVFDMKMPDAWLGELTQARMTDPQAGLVAPLVVWGAVGSLNGGPIPDCVSVRANVTDDGTTWQAVWVQDLHVGFVEAHHSRANWSAHSSEAAPETITAWRRPVSQVVAVELTDMECRRVSTYSDREGEWQWHSGARIAFSDGSTVDLLPFGRAIGRGRRARATAARSVAR